MKGFDWKRIRNGLLNNKALIQLDNFTGRLVGSKSKSKSSGQEATKPTIPQRPPGRPPKFVTGEPVAMRDLTSGELLQRNILSFVAVTMAIFLANLFVFSHIQHASSQEQLRSAFTEKLALATAPTSEGDENLFLLTDGSPVAYIEIPAIGVSEVVVEGTDSTALRGGPGHRRDTVLPGQSGTSVIMGRASAFGGPFGSIHTLKPGTLFSVVTGQGQHTYKVIGMRYAGEPEPAPAPQGVSRLVLETARGLPYSPTGVTRVDAQMVSTSGTYSPSELLTGIQPCYPAPPSPSPSIAQTTSPTPSESASSETASASPSPSPSVVGTTSPTPSESASAGAVSASPSPSPSVAQTTSPSPSVSASSGTESTTQGEQTVNSPSTQGQGECLTPSPTPTESLGAPSVSPSPSVNPSGATEVSEIATGSTTFNSNVKAFASGARLTSAQTLPLEHRALASDMTTLWALVFALQFLVLVEILVIWSVGRFGLRKAWVAGMPVVLLASILASDQLIRLLPNLT